MDQFDLYLQYQKEVAQAKIKIIDRFQHKERRKPEKRTSKIDVVHNVLNSAGHPLHVSDIIKMAQELYQVQLNRDSIVSAILKKITAGQTFIKTAPNTFALKTYTNE
jgi:DNA-directed RNA polymerase delta subunit